MKSNFFYMIVHKAFLLLILTSSFFLLSCATITELWESTDPNQSLSSTTKSSSNSVNISLDKTKQQLLLRYVQEGNIDGIKKAIELGADVNYGVYKSEPNLPLMNAVEQYYSGIYTAKILGRGKEDLPKYQSVMNYLKELTKDLNIMWKNGRSVSVSMCGKTFRACQKAIDEWGIDPNSSTAWTHLKYTTNLNKERDQILSYLLDRGLNPMLGNNPFMFMDGMSVSLTEKLLSHGAKGWVNEFTDSRKTEFPLYNAITRYDIVKAKLFLRYGADVHQGCERTLFKAIYNEKPETVRLLLEHGADPNNPCRGKRETALETALNEHNTEVIDLLISYGAK